MSDGDRGVRSIRIILYLLSFFFCFNQSDSTRVIILDFWSKDSYTRDSEPYMIPANNEEFSFSADNNS